MKTLRLTAVLCVALFLAACSAVNPPIRTTSGPEAALIYGFIDMSDSPRKLTKVYITGNEKSGIAYRQSVMTTYPDGLFFVENAAPMEYLIPFFFTEGSARGDVLHNLNRSREDLFAVQPGEMVSVGTFKYVITEEGGVFAPESFALQPAASPNEAQVLMMLRTAVQDPRWKKRIGARLSQLGQTPDG